MGKAKQVSWNQVVPARVYLVAGTEDFLAARAVRSIKDGLRSVNPAIEVSELLGSAYEPGNLIELTAPSLFDEPRLVIIEGVEACSDALIEDGLEYLGDISGESTVVFIHSGGVRGKKLLDALRNSDAVLEVKCDKIEKDADRITFATNEFKALNRRATPGAIRLLVAAFGQDVAGLASACSQLTLDAADTIDEDAVNRYYGGRTETDTFKIMDAALSGDADQALLLCRHAFLSGVEPVLMVGGIAHKIRAMARVLNNRSITAGQVGGSNWVFERARKDALGWTEAGMANVVRELARTDAAAKGAEKDANFAMERLLLLICSKGVPIVR